MNQSAIGERRTFRDALSGRFVMAVALAGCAPVGPKYDAAEDGRRRRPTRSSLRALS